MDGLFWHESLAAELGTTRATVGKWRKRSIGKGLEGLLDEPRPGAPRQIGDDDVERVVVETLESLPRTATHLSSATVARIWQAFALKPHRHETFKLSKDPQFVAKVRDIVGLYLHPPSEPWCCASTRRRRSKPWTAPSRSCRCDRAYRNAGRTTTSGTARPRCSPRSTSQLGG